MGLIEFLRTCRGQKGKFTFRHMGENRVRLELKGLGGKKYAVQIEEIDGEAQIITKARIREERTRPQMSAANQKISAGVRSAL